MENSEKTKEQLLKEIDQLKVKITELEKAKANQKKTKANQKKVKEAEDKLRTEKEQLDEKVNERTKELNEINEKLKFEIIERKQAEKTVIENEEKYRILIEKNQDGVFLIQDGLMKLVNPAFASMIGYNVKELIGMGFRKLIAPEDEEMVAERYRRRQVGENIPSRYEFKMLCKDGKTRVDVFMSVGIINFKGKVTSIGTLHDITERKRAKEELQESEKKYRLISETTSDLIALATFSLNPVYTYVSPSIKSFGYEIEDVIGKPCFDFIHPDDKKKLFPLLKKYVSAKSKKLFSGKDSDISEIIENRVIDKYGNWHYFQSTVNILGNQILFISKNITERKKAEQALQASETQYKNLYSMIRLMSDNLPDLIWAKDMESKFLFVNKACSEILLDAKDTDEPIGKTDIYFAQRGIDSHPEIPDYFTFGQMCTDSDLATLDQNKPIRFDESGNVRGKFLFLDVYKAPLTDENGNIIGTVGSARVVTKERQMEEELQKSEERYRNIFDNTGTATLIIEENTIISLANQGFADLSGYSRKEIEGQKSWTDFVVPEDLERMKEQHKLRRENENTALNNYEFRFIDKDNNVKNILLTIDMVPGTKKSVASLLDITESKQAEEALKQSEKSYRDLFNNATDAIYIQDREGRFLDVNQGAVDMYGYPKEFFMGKTPGFLSAPEKNNMKKIMGFVEDAFNGKPRQYDFWGIRKNGKVFPKIVRSKKGFYLGKEVVITFALDITERKQAEKIQKALYNISNALNTTDKMRDFYGKIREYLGNVIDTTNFYVALYDEKTDMISLPFNVDEKDDFETFPAGKTLTSLVIKTGNPLFANKQLQDELAKQGKIEIIGTRSEIWLGVPLKIENKVIGVIVVQSYDNPHLYSEKDIDILTFVSEEIALAIKHKQAEEELHKRLNELETFNRVTVGRELKMIELKKEINELLEKSGKEAIYKIAE